MIEDRLILTLTSPMLGTATANKEVYRNWIASLRKDENGETAIDEAEIESLPTVDEEVADKMTVFHRTPDGHPMIYTYMLKGLMKAACWSLRRIKGKDSEYKSHKLTSYKMVISGHVFFAERTVRLDIPEEFSIPEIRNEPYVLSDLRDGGHQTLPTLQRPLRAETAKGPRVALACSEAVPAGTKIACTLRVLDPQLRGLIHDEWLPYGELKGLGQWNNAAWGRFTTEWLDD